MIYKPGAVDPSLLRCYAVSKGERYSHSQWSHSFKSLLQLLDPENKGNTTLRNVWNYSRNNELKSQKTWILATPLWNFKSRKPGSIHTQGNILYSYHTYKIRYVTDKDPRLVEKFPTFEGTQSLITVYYSPPLVPLMSQMNPVQALPCRVFDHIHHLIEWPEILCGEIYPQARSKRSFSQPSALFQHTTSHQEHPPQRGGGNSIQIAVKPATSFCSSFCPL